MRNDELRTVLNSSFRIHHSSFLVRERLAVAGDADAVVRELRVGAGQLDLGHVAGAAGLRGDGAGPGVAAVRGLRLSQLRRLQARARAVAGEALRVVESLVVLRVLVDVVAGGA